MRILGKIVYGIFVTALVGVAGLLLVSLLPITGNVEIKIVKSGSMEPSIPVGSVVVVVPSTSYEVGEVITFGHDTAREIPTTHRIVAKRTEGPSASSGQAETYYTTKGDANEEQDPREVMQSDVIGKVFLHVPFVGYVLDFARQPLGFALLIGVPALFIVIDESMNIYREVAALRRRRRYKLEARYMPVPQKPRYFEKRDHMPTI